MSSPERLKQRGCRSCSWQLQVGVEQQGDAVQEELLVLHLQLLTACVSGGSRLVSGPVARVISLGGRRYVQ
jgi:hypothetical protein